MQQDCCARSRGVQEDLPVDRGLMSLLEAQDQSVDLSVLQGCRMTFVFEFLELGGAERIGLRLAQHFRDRYSAKVNVIGFDMPGRASEICTEMGIPWRIVPIRWGGGPAGKVRELCRLAFSLRRDRPDVILPFTIVPNVTCGLAWRYTGAKLCVWNQRDNGGIYRLGQRAETLAVRRVPQFISNTQDGAGFLASELSVPRGRISVVYNGVKPPQPESTGAQWRERLGVGSDAFVGLMVANLHPRKDHETLLRAWALVVESLRQANREAILLLAGYDCGCSAHLKVCAFDLGLAREVRFLGQVKDIDGLALAADCGVLSALYEGVANGVLECMSAALPVVVTDAAGLPEAVGAPPYPYVAPPGDAATFARHILEFANSKELSLRIGAANRQRILEHFTPEAMYNGFASVIATALACPSGGRARR